MADSQAELREGLEKLIEELDVKSILKFDEVAHEILIRRALSKGRGSRSTAKELGIGKSTLCRKMKMYGIEPKT